MKQNPSDQRRRLILDRARGDGRVQVTELATVLDVAAETVRRDLRILEDHGNLRRTHGGALPIDKAGFEAGISQRSAQSVPEKQRIARAAVKSLEGCESLFLDEGSTTTAVADVLLSVDQPLTIVTPSIAVAALLTTRPRTDVLMLGGTVRSASIATAGSAATTMLSELTVDVAILSASGISLGRGVSTSNPKTASLKRAAMHAGRKRLFIGPHTKFGISSFCRYGDVHDFHAVITDTGLPNNVATTYRGAGIRLIRA